MTAARQQRKPTPFSLLLGLVLACGIFAPQDLKAAPEQRLVVNPDTGLAISGFDPVAYFVDRKPRSGKPDLELSRGGAVWRFGNEGNRDEFARHPEVYEPRFGGYDPVAVSGGRSVPGHPLVWAVVGERLYLFYDEDARADFLADPGRIIPAAERRWPDVARSIGR
jgi:hypothetical protein